MTEQPLDLLALVSFELLVEVGAHEFTTERVVHSLEVESEPTMRRDPVAA